VWYGRWWLAPSDLGGGIGRVVSGVLAPLFDRVDLAEPNSRFLETAKSTVGDRV
jgi:hypothetical protein